MRRPAVLLALFALVPAVVHGCASDLTPPVANCQPFATRCDGQLAQVCSASQRWRTAADCRAVEPSDRAWRCCADADGRAVCVPEEECHGPR